MRRIYSFFTEINPILEPYQGKEHRTNMHCEHKTVWRSFRITEGITVVIQSMGILSSGRKHICDMQITVNEYGYRNEVLLYWVLLGNVYFHTNIIRIR